MKKKLLTVLLAVVMVFGVFGLTACGGSNKDEDYNYYGVKYSIEDEVKIEAVTFQAVYKMFTTPGNFVLYVNSGESAADFQAVNKLANDWDVTIYHFNPDLTGGYAKDLSNAVNANLCSDLTGIAAESQLKAVQDLLLSISKKDLAFWKEADGKILAIAGADSTANADGTIAYKGSVKAANTVADGAKSIATIAIKNPSYGSYTDDAKDVPYIPAAYNTDAISTMNLFADARLHIYDDRDALTEEKTDVFVTVANYEMFAHLMDNNDGYFAVFFGGTWCPNTQAILYHVNYLAKDYGMNKVYFFDPRLDDGVRLDQVVASTAFDQNAYDKDVAAAESVAAIAKLAAESTYESAILAADKAYEVAINAANKAQEDAYFAAEQAYKAAYEAAEKAYNDTDAIVKAAYAEADAADKAYKAAKKAYDDLKEAATSLAADVKAAKDAYDAAVKAKGEADKAVTAAEEALKAIQKENAKALSYAADVKADAEAAFQASLKAYTKAKTDLATAEKANDAAERKLKSKQEAFDALTETSLETTVERVTKELEEAKDEANKAAVALDAATEAFEAAAEARKPLYDASLNAAAAYEDLVAANTASEKAAQKVIDDAKKAQTKAGEAVTATNKAYTDAQNYKTNGSTGIVDLVEKALADTSLSNVKYDTVEDLAYLVERLVAIYDADLAVAEKALADAEEALAKAQEDFEIAKEAVAKEQGAYDDAVAARKALDAELEALKADMEVLKADKAAVEAQIKAIQDEIAWMDAEKDSVDAETIAALKEEIEDLKVVINDKDYGIDADITALQKEIDGFKLTDDYKAATKAESDALTALNKIKADAKVDYATKEAAVKEGATLVTAVANAKAAVEAIEDKITYANEKVAFETAKFAADEAQKAAYAAYEAAYIAYVKASGATGANKVDTYTKAQAMKADADAAYIAAAQKAAVEAAEKADAELKAATDAADAAFEAAYVAAVDAVAADKEAAYEAKAAAIEAAEADLAAVRTSAGNVTTYSVTENKQNITGNLNTRNNDNTGAAYNYNYTYGSFLKNYLPTYWSEWNITAELTITVGTETSKYTRMCVPNIMMFNGEKENAKAELIALAEAEYVWANTSVEGNPYRLAWEAAVKEVYDANPYATYAPIVVAPEASTDSAAGGSSSSSSAPAAGAGDSAC